MRLILSIFFLLISYTLIGQTVYNLSAAKTIALAENKLIIIDFCGPCFGPCTKRDYQIWNNTEFEKLYDRFVLARIDRTQYFGVADLYQVGTAPRILVQTIKDDIIIDRRVSIEPLHFLHLLQSFPTDYEELNNRSLELMNKKAPPIKFYELGEAFRITGMKTNNRNIRDSFLSKSKMYYRKTENVSESIELKQISVLSQLRIDAYQGRIQKVKKKLNKIEVESESIKVIEMIDFVKAYCYKSEGDINGMLEAKERIKDPELLKELE